MPCEALLKKGRESNFTAHSAAANLQKCPPLDCKSLFATVYNILASFSDLTNPPVQYSIYVWKTDYTDFVVVNSQETMETTRLAFVARSCLFDNLH